MFGGFRENHYFCSNFLKPGKKMMINHKTRTLFAAVALMAMVSPSVAQTKMCKDTTEHRRLEIAMWTAGGQDNPEVLYEACRNFHEHALAEKDIYSACQAWICGAMFNLGRMNIRDAYLITRQMGEELTEDKDATEERYFMPNMMGHVYSTCGNISGAVEEFQKAAEAIKGTQYESDGLAFIYLALAHAQLNNDLEEAQHWIDETKTHLEKHQNTRNYYRAKADAYALEGIVKFKLHNIPGFRQSLAEMEKADSCNTVPSGDIFLPYARIYEILLDGDVERALKEAEKLNNEKELYLVKCDVYNYIGDKDKAFLTQRELMHKRDSITGIMIIDNLETHENEISLLKEQAKMSRRIYLILVHTVFLAILVIVLMARNTMIRRRSRKRLLAKNAELRAAYKQVSAADKMRTEFIRNISHEIRTPLNIINGFTQVLTEESMEFDPDERRTIGNTISDNTLQITSLVNKILALANESSQDLISKVEETDALDVCRKAIQGMPHVDATNVEVLFDDQIPEGEEKFFTNGYSLLMMLSYMLENSVKFTEKGHIRLMLERDDSHFLFSVEDTGCGIPEDKVEVIFERFMKVDEFKEGLGLGLAYCYETAQKLGGNLRLAQTSKEGTTFTLSLPIKLNKT